MVTVTVWANGNVGTAWDSQEVQAGLDGDLCKICGIGAPGLGPSEPSPGRRAPGPARQGSVSGVLFPSGAERTLCRAFAAPVPRDVGLERRNWGLKLPRQ